MAQEQPSVIKSKSPVNEQWLWTSPSRPFLPPHPSSLAGGRQETIYHTQQREVLASLPKGDPHTCTSSRWFPQLPYLLLARPVNSPSRDFRHPLQGRSFPKPPHTSPTLPNKPLHNSYVLSLSPQSTSPPERSYSFHQERSQFFPLHPDVYQAGKKNSLFNQPFFLFGWGSVIL